MDVRITQEDTEQPLTVSDNTDLDELLIEEEYGRKGMFMKEYLIKWKGLAYCDISWECYDDFQNQECILEYYNHLYDIDSIHNLLENVILVRIF